MMEWNEIIQSVSIMLLAICVFIQEQTLKKLEKIINKGKRKDYGINYYK